MKVPSDCVIKAAQNCYKTYGILPSVQIAQWALESAWGSKCTGKFNFFGVKAVKGQKGSICWTHENIDGKLTPIMQRFADYDSVEDAFIHHAEMLTDPEGNFAKTLPYRNNLTKYVNSIGPIYATDKNYSQKLLDFIRIDGFQKYDTVET